MKRQKSPSDDTSVTSEATKVGNEKDLPHVIQSSLEECEKPPHDYHGNPRACDEIPIALQYAAAEHGYSECVRLMLDHHADTKVIVDQLVHTDTPLIAAVIYGCTECVKLLLEHHADPNLRNDEFLNTPLIVAVKSGNTECLKILLDYHADPNLRNKFSQTPLIAAAQNGNTECIKILLDYHADPNLRNDKFSLTPLIAAAHNGNRECIKILLDCHADPNLRKDEFSQTPLIAAAQRGNTECVKILLDYHADPNLRNDKLSLTPLIAAAQNGNTECVKILLDCHADPNLRKDEFSQTPLIAAAENDNTECVKILLDYHADPNLRNDEFPQTPLIAAVENGNTECVKILLDYHADPCLFVNLPGKHGFSTPVHLAISCNSPACIKLLLNEMGSQHLAHAADYTSPNYTCPLQVAVLEKKHKCLETLLLWGFPVNNLHHRNRNGFDRMHSNFIRDADVLSYAMYEMASLEHNHSLPLSRLETALSLAAFMGNLVAMNILWKYGASVNPVCCNINNNAEMQLNFSYPPILSALVRKSREAVDFLIKHGSDINYHFKDIPTNQCLLFTFHGSYSTKYLLLQGSDPHLLFQKGSIHSQRYFVGSLTAFLQEFMNPNFQYRILRILELLLQFTAVTGPVQSSFHAVSVKCREVFKAEYYAKTWNKFLQKVDTPSSLKNLCRIKTRQLVICKHGYFSFRTAINHLQLPQQLNQYLLYHELDDDDVHNS